MNALHISEYSMLVMWVGYELHISVYLMFLMWIGLLTDFWLSPVSSISVIFGTRTNSIILKKKLYRNDGYDRASVSTTFGCHCKSMESWTGTNDLVFCSGYNEFTLFLNLQRGL